MIKKDCWVLVSRLMSVIRRLDSKSSDLVYAIDENGLDNRDYSDQYREIGKRFVKLHGTHEDYLHKETHDMLELLVQLSKQIDPDVEISADDLSDLIMGCYGKEYTEERNKMLVRLSSDPTIVDDLLSENDEDEVYDVEDEDEDDEDEDDEAETIDLMSEKEQSINHHNLDPERWTDITNRTASYVLEKNARGLYGVIIPEDLYDFFEISEIVENDESNRDELCRIFIRYNRTTYKCDFIKASIGVVLLWPNVIRKRLMSKHPECFDYGRQKTGKKHVVITIDKSRLDLDEYYTMRSIGKKFED